MLRALLLALVFATLPSLGAESWDAELEAARAARLKLGGGAWARVIAIENAAPDSRLGKRVPALVFELGSRLWLYLPALGTESLSRRAGRLAEEKSDLQPLLSARRSAFVSHTVIDAESSPRPVKPHRVDRLPNACFIVAVAHWRALQAQSNPPQNARLVAYFPRGRARGHTVLYYESGGRRWIFDPDRPEAPLRYPLHRARDDAAIATFLLAHVSVLPLASAQSLPLDTPLPAPRTRHATAHLSATENRSIDAPAG
jgi:hypothetical protein